MSDTTMKAAAVSEFAGDLNYAEQILCRVMPKGQNNNYTVYLLAGILLKLASIDQMMAIGRTYFRITNYKLNNNAQLILDNEASDKPRRVVLWFDALQTGQPFPTIRIGPNISNATTGGIQVAPGTVQDLGIVPARQKLLGASNAALGTNVYVIEHG